MPPVPPPVPPPYGPLSYGPPFAYPYPPPPKRDNLVLIVVLILVVLLIVPTTIAAFLYIFVSGMISNPTPGPQVTLGPLNQTAGNATLILTTTGRLDPPSLRLWLQADQFPPVDVGMPGPDSSVTVLLGNYTVRIFWLDNDRDNLLDSGDALWFTGNLAPLPPRTDFTFFVRWLNGGAGTGWTTP